MQDNAEIKSADALRRIRRLRFRAMRFRLSPEWRILIKRLKTPPFRRKPESHSSESRNLLPSHSCEGRNLYAEGGNCTISRRFAAAEIPAFAGMGRGVQEKFWVRTVAPPTN
ncbi:MAG: hypothetical protein ACR2QC_10140 [Gammaproteobacteria bacterium]